MRSPEIMTTAEVAELLRVSPRKIQLMANSKELPCLRVGTLYRFSREAIVAKLRDAGWNGENR